VSTVAIDCKKRGRESIKKRDGVKINGRRQREERKARYEEGRKEINMETEKETSYQTQPPNVGLEGFISKGR
jgi:hypothetical protein